MRCMMIRWSNRVVWKVVSFSLAMVRSCVGRLRLNRRRGGPLWCGVRTINGKEAT